MDEGNILRQIRELRSRLDALFSDNWVTLAGQGGAGWDASGADCQYLAIGSGAIAFRGQVQTPVSGPYNGVNAFTVPLSELPVATRRWGVVNPTSTSVTGYGVLGSNGIVQFEGLPGGYNNSPIDINGVVLL